jgi:hypothetical protein
MTMKLCRPAAWLTVALVAVAGCSRPPATAAAPHQKAAGTHQKAGGLASPFNGLTSQPPAEAERLELALDGLIAKCMSSRSYDYHIPPLRMLPGSVTHNPYGLISLSAASRSGYGISDSFLADQQNETIGQEPQPQASRPGFMAALTGTRSAAAAVTLPGGGKVTYNANGCVTIAIDRLYGRTWDTVYYTVSTAGLSVVTHVEASAGWKAGVKAWSACMASHDGGSFSSPTGPPSAVDSKLRTQLSGLSGAALRSRLKLLRASEVKLAVTDARCQAATGLPNAVSAAQNTVERPYLTRYAADLKTYLTDMQHAWQMTTTLLAEHPTR